MAVRKCHRKHLSASATDTFRSSWNQIQGAILAVNRIGPGGHLDEVIERKRGFGFYGLSRRMTSRPASKSYFPHTPFDARLFRVNAEMEISMYCSS